MKKKPTDNQLYYGPVKVDDIIESKGVVVTSILYMGRRITADVRVTIRLKNGLVYSTATTLHKMNCES